MRTLGTAENSFGVALLLGLGAFFSTGAASAHVSLISGPGFANTTQEVTFGVGHGCAGADTYSVRVEIPSVVTSVRPVRGTFGKASVEKDAQLNIVAVTWQKEDIDVLDADVEYYKLTMRIKVPDQPFTQLYFPATQVCRAADGTQRSVEWVSMPGMATDGSEGEPAPSLAIVPTRRAGWNKFAVSQAVPDLSVFFDDALIVWRGSAAYSKSPTTADLIKATTGVSALTALAVGDELWVRY